MIKLGFEYKDEHDKISMQHTTDDESTAIEWYIEKFCDFLVGLKFRESIIQKYIPYDGQIYEMVDWMESEEE